MASTERTGHHLTKSQIRQPTRPLIRRASWASFASIPRHLFNPSRWQVKTVPEDHEVVERGRGRQRFPRSRRASPLRPAPETEK